MADEHDDEKKPASEPPAKSESPAAAKSEPPAAAKSEPPATKSAPPVAAKSEPPAKSDPPVAAKSEPATKSEPPATRSEPPAAASEPPAAASEPPAAASEPPAAASEPPSGSSEPPPSEPPSEPPSDDVERRPALFLAEFETTGEVMHAAERVRDEGYEHWDVHTPFPVHGMDKAMGLGDSHLGWIALGAGLTGLIGAYVMMYWMNGVDYPLIVGGKPPEAIPSMVPILFECTVLLSGLSCLFGMLGLNKLPRHHHPIFYSDRFERCSDDRFFISIEAADPKFDLEGTRDLLESLSPSFLELVEEEVS